jgi:hypothetical protein
MALLCSVHLFSVVSKTLLEMGFDNLIPVQSTSGREDVREINGHLGYLPPKMHTRVYGARSIISYPDLRIILINCKCRAHGRDVKLIGLQETNTTSRIGKSHYQTRKLKTELTA